MSSSVGLETVNTFLLGWAGSSLLVVSSDNFCFWVGVVKSMFDISAKGTDQNEDGNQAVCEKASPMPAIHVQCAHNTSPFCLVTTHTLREGGDSLCECLTKTINIKILDLAIWLPMTVKLVTQPI